MVLAVLTAGVLHKFLPNAFRVIPHGSSSTPCSVLVFLAACIVGDPRLTDQQRRGCGSPAAARSDSSPALPNC
jgi:hypothetical protein